MDNLKNRPGDFDHATRDRLIAGTLQPAPVVAKAQRVRRHFLLQALALLDRYDVLMAPATPFPAQPIGQSHIELNGETVLIRAVGPTLSAFGVPGALADAKLELYSGSARIQTNDNWGEAANSEEVATAFGRVGAFPLSRDTKDAAMLVTLTPGGYTAQVTGNGATNGVALVEVYELP